MTLQKDWAKTQVRLPPDLHPVIKEYAKNNNLSMNTAILDLIQKSLDSSSILTSNKPTLKANYFTQKLYGFIHMANRLESRISNTEYVLKHTTEPKEKERYTILLDISQHDLEQLRKDIETAFNTLKKENANIGQELALEVDTILKKSTN